MSDWAALKAKRSGSKAGAASASDDPEPGRSSETGSDIITVHRRDGMGASVAGEPQAKADGDEILNFDDLPSTLEIRLAPGRGRGVFLKETVYAGTTLISTMPLVSVLDNRELSTRCSSCFLSESDVLDRTELLRCSSCRVLRYCSVKCQRADWTAHKEECKGLVIFAKATKDSNRGQATGAGFPDTPVRALGRLLWAKAKKGDAYWKEIESLQSHRTTLSSADQEKFFQLSIKLAAYVGPEIFTTACSSAAAVMDLCSRFAANSFSLTSPHLSNIGVSISPLVALLNHSCVPNAVVVFPSRPSTLNTKYMRVVAIRPIVAGEEISTSYIDLALPRRLRQLELSERYAFDCVCDLCEKGNRGSASFDPDWVDPREALRCGIGSCEGVVRMPEQPEGQVETFCGQCGSAQLIDAAELRKSILEGEGQLALAEKQQYDDPETACTTLFTSAHALIRAGIAPSSHPHLATSQVLLAVDVQLQEWAPALAAAIFVSEGVVKIFPEGHPTRAIAAASLAKLRVSGTHPGDEGAFWADKPGIIEVLVKLQTAMEEVDMGFGKDSLLGKELRDLMREIQEGMWMTTMRTAAMAGRVA